MRSLRLLVVVQRYGEDFSGGAEAHARYVAEGLAARGHRVEVATTRAKSYADWANHYDGGTESLNGVPVHRFDVSRPREDRLFSYLSLRVMVPRKDPAPLFVQRTWQQLQGPESDDLLAFLDDESGRFDVVLFFTYLYWPSVAGVAIARRHAPTVLQTLIHDEPSFHMPAQDDHILGADRIICSVPEEAELIRARFGSEVTIGIAGVGTNVDVTGDGQRFRDAFGLGERPYLLYVGRVDPSKGVRELYEQFRTYKERNDDDLVLVLLGEALVDLGDHEEVITTGFVSDQDRADAIAGCTMLVNPSYYESFSMVITEAWALRKPVLVNARCRVLAEQVARTEGGIAYDGFDEFETAIEVLAWDPERLAVLGEAGRAYTEDHYTWERVLGRYELHLQLAASRSRIRV